MTSQYRDTVERRLSEWRRQRPDLDPSPLGIQGRIMMLSAHLLRQSEAWLEPLGLSWEAFSLIVTLRRSGEPYALRPTDLLRESLLTSGAITNRIDRVEQRGLVERHPDPKDRRSSIVQLTPAGLKLADEAIGRHFAGVEARLGGLTAAERQQLAGLLSKLLGSVETTAAQRTAHHLKDRAPPREG